MGFFSRKKDCTKNIAKNRLKLVLIHDRSNISHKVLEEIRKDVILAISKHIDIDIDGLVLEMNEVDGNVRKAALVANIPIKS